MYNETSMPCHVASSPATEHRVNVQLPCQCRCLLLGYVPDLQQMTKVFGAGVGGVWLSEGTVHSVWVGPACLELEAFVMIKCLSHDLSSLMLSGLGMSCVGG